MNANSLPHAQLEAWRAGDDRAGAALLASFVPTVYRFFRRRDPTSADELTQRTMLEIMESRLRFAPRDSLRGYLLGIARHQWLAELRRRNAAAPPPESGQADGVCTRVGRREARGRLQRALCRLPLSQQLTLEMHYWEGLSTREIAEALDVPVGTIKWRLAEARRALRRSLERLPPLLGQSVTAETKAWLGAMRRELFAARASSA